MPTRITQRIDQVPTGDITAVTAGVAISGGGTSGAGVISVNKSNINDLINVVLEDDDIVIAGQVYN